MVIGLYGGWGSGKTSLIKMVESILSQSMPGDKGFLPSYVCTPDVDKPCKTSSPRKPFIITFNPWAFQNADNPALCLVQALVSAYDKDLSSAEKRKLQENVTMLIKSTALKVKLPFIEADVDLNKYAKQAQKQLDAQVKQRENYAEVIDKILEYYDRIIFFIDDLDRCLPEQALRLLEALKLYLNQPGCVYFLAVDNHQLEKGIEHHLGRSLVTINGSNYLDKIVQLPFYLPGIGEGVKKAYVEKYLACIPDNKRLVTLVCAGLDDVPRKMKRFLIDLRMNHVIGMRHKGYNVHMAAFVLFIQWRSPELYAKMGQDSRLLLKMTSHTDDGKDLRRQYVDSDERLKKVIELAMKVADVPRDEDEVRKYISLSRFVIDNELLKERDDVKEFEDAIGPHQEWISSGGSRGTKADLLRRQLAGYNNPNYLENDTEASLREIDPEKEKRLNLDLSRAHMFGIFMEYADMSECRFYETNMEEAALSGVRFRGCDMTRVNFKGADLKKAFFEGATLTEAQLWLADLSESKMMGAILCHANLADADLNKADLTEAELFGADLTRANLENVTLRETRMVKANLRGANLKDSKAEKTCFAGAYLKGASLVNAQLMNADFTNAVLSNADFTAADMKGAILDGADLSGVDLTVAKNVAVQYLALEKEA